MRQIQCQDGVDEMLMRKCKCGKEISLDVGDYIQNEEYLWHISSHCKYCGDAFEIDGHGIFDIPDDAEQEIINKSGEWSIVAKGSLTKINFLLKRIINIEYNIEDLQKEKVIYTGTQNQVNWVKSRLIEKGISEKKIVIKYRRNR